MGFKRDIPRPYDAHPQSPLNPDSVGKRHGKSTAPNATVHGPDTAPTIESLYNPTGGAAHVEYSRQWYSEIEATGRVSLSYRPNVFDADNRRSLKLLPYFAYDISLAHGGWREASRLTHIVFRALNGARRDK